MDSSGGDDDDQQQQSPQLLSSGGGEEKIMMMNEGSPTPTPIIAPPPPPPKAETSNFIGKHRMAAALAHLQHQIQIIQEELEELETCGESSLVCKETKGPAVVGWDRWFHGAHGSRGRKRWI
ncbi:hypothetical protein CsSME_00048702 [Camellia sinensis var. sinensis]